MPNLEHVAIDDPNIHEPKGASTAGAGAVYVADGAGSGDWIKQVFRLTPTLTPASVAANTTAEQTFTCTGLVSSTDTILSVSKPAAQAGLGIVGWRVSADNQIGITFCNVTGTPIVPTASQTYEVVVYRRA